MLDEWEVLLLFVPGLGPSENLFLPSFFLFDFVASTILESWILGHLLPMWHLGLHPYLSAYWKAVSVVAGTALALGSVGLGLSSAISGCVTLGNSPHFS